MTVTLVALCAKLAKADGQVTRAEVAAFKRLIHIKPQEEPYIRTLFDMTRKTSQGYEAYAKRATEALATQPQRLRDILSGLMLVAGADGHFTKSEHDFIYTVAKIFGLSDSEFMALASRYGNPHAYCPYAVLGLDKDASHDEVKASYRKLARSYHPDLLQAQGLSEHLIKLAQANMAQINKAYQQIMQIDLD